MKLGELIAACEALRAEHGGDVDVIIEGYAIDNEEGDDRFIQASIEKLEAEYRCADEPSVFIVMKDVTIDD